MQDKCELLFDRYQVGNLQRNGTHDRMCSTCGICRWPIIAILVGINAVPVLGQVIHEKYKFFPIDGAGGHTFGQSLAIDSETIVIGMQHDDDNGSESGSAYLFDADTGTQIAKLLPSDGTSFDSFGYGVTISNGIVAIGAANYDANGYGSGSVYIFDADSGEELWILLASDGDVEDAFGRSVATDGGIVAVGAVGDTVNGMWSGSAYLFDLPTGVQLAKLVPVDGVPDARFGFSIAVNDGVVAVGAVFDDDNGARSGSVYLFDALTGIQINKLTAADGEAGDEFGWSVAIDGGIIAVGAHRDDGVGYNSGSAYLFDVSTGAQIAKLVPMDSEGGDVFGRSVDINNGIVLVGATANDDYGAVSGAAYIFNASTGEQIAKLLRSDGDSYDWFGEYAALDDGYILISALADDDNGTDSGSAYIFDYDCFADRNGDGMVDTQDFILFLSAWSSRDPSADWNFDSGIDTRDFIAYLAEWAGGC